MSRRLSLRGIPQKLLGANVCLLAGVLLFAAACMQESGMRESSGRQAFIERLGSDTISIEVYTRTPEGFQGDLLIRSPVTRVAHYEATLTPEGAIQRMDVQWETPAENPEGPGPSGYTVTFDGDSATLETRGGENPGTTRIEAASGVIPTVGKTPLAFAVMEQAVRQAVASGADSFPIQLLSGTRARVSSNAIVRFAADSVRMSFFGSPLVAEVDQSGPIIGRSGRHTTFVAEGERISDVDVASLASEFAARDASGEGMGIASPTETVEAVAAGAGLSIIYSRPGKRGREIWGGLVPWNEVWRTGANSATAFTTDRDVEIGGATVPAGAYTLWSIYTPESAQLIINRQTGQWGTQYDEGQDLVRVDLTAEMLSEPLERFTIAVEAAEDGATLALSWDQNRYTVPIKAR